MSEPLANTASMPAEVFHKLRPLQQLTFIAIGTTEYPRGEDGGPPKNPPRITAEKYKEWKPRIDEIVSSFRREYTNPDLHGEEYRQYYAPCWKMFDEAKNEQETAEALDYFISSLRWQ